MIGDIQSGVDLVLVDLWKDLYLPCIHAVLPKLNPGTIVVGDNIHPGLEDTRPYVDAVRAVPGMRSVTPHVGQGLEISRLRAA